MPGPAGVREAEGTVDNKITYSTFNFKRLKNSWLPSKVTGRTYGEYNDEADEVILKYTYTMSCDVHVDL